jgi:hypothetical protein
MFSRSRARARAASIRRTRELASAITDAEGYGQMISVIVSRNADDGLREARARTTKHYKSMPVNCTHTVDTAHQDRAISEMP